MSNTIIQIRRSTETTTPTSLQNGELAFTSNGDTLWIGSPAGSNTANVVHIGSKISYNANSTQLGDVGTAGSNAELASTFAISKFVTDKFTAYSTSLEGLDDVDVATQSNNDILVYDAASSKWENHTIAGNTNQIEVTFTNNDIIVSLSNNVVVTGTANIAGETHIANLVHVDTTGGDSTHFQTNPIFIATANTDSWTQVSIQNKNGGANSSADFISYPNNTQADDNTGFIDMGITSNGYNQAAYSVTGPNDGYLFASARSGDNLGGSLVLATDSSGTNNDIKMFVGGFTFDANAPHVVLAGNTRALGINNAAPVSKLSVGGDGWVDGKIQARNILPLANVTYSLGNTNLWYTHAYANTIVGSNGYFDTVTGTLQTAAQPNITSVGNLDNLTVTGTASLNSDVTLGATSTDTVTLNGKLTGDIIPTSNVTYDVGSADFQFDKMYASNAYFTNVLVGGDLTVQGTLTTIDTVNLTIKDSMMSLADQQANSSLFTDTVDIGFFGQYGNTSQTVYTGLARHALSNTYILFDGLNQLPNNVVNTAAVSIATLNTYVLSGGLSTNSTAVTITANSTVEAAIVANTLSLTTALAVGSGGTGKTSLTSNYIMVGNNAGAVTMVGSSTEGHVLQINGSGAPTFAGLDGGTF